MTHTNSQDAKDGATHARWIFVAAAEKPFSQHLPLQRARRASGRAGKLVIAPNGAWILVGSHFYFDCPCHNSIDSKHKVK
jgi:hypothetical protein